MGKYDDAIGSVTLKISVDDVLSEAPWEHQKRDIVALLNSLERELTELMLVPGAEAGATRALQLANHIKSAVRDGEQLDIDKIRVDLRK